MSNELLFQVALELIPGLGSRGIKQLISYCGSASNVFSATKSKLLKIPGVGPKAPLLNDASKIIEDAERIEAVFIHYTHPKFPKRLNQIPDSPTLLFNKGNGDLNPARCVAIVGTRKATDYGKRVEREIYWEVKFF